MWKPIENYNSLYEVNEKGEVRSLYHWNGHKYEKRKKPYILKQSNTTTGYKKVELAKDGKKKSLKVHRLVANAFIPKIKGKNIVNHKDFNLLNNNIDNLEWVTQRENVLYSVENMKHRKSITHSNTKEKYITYRAKKKAYRVIIDRKERGTFKTLEEAIKKRNSILEKGSDAK